MGGLGVWGQQPDRLFSPHHWWKPLMLPISAEKWRICPANKDPSPIWAEQRKSLHWGNHSGSELPMSLLTAHLRSGGAKEEARPPEKAVSAIYLQDFPSERFTLRFWGSINEKCKSLTYSCFRTPQAHMGTGPPAGLVLWEKSTQASLTGKSCPLTAAASSWVFSAITSQRSGFPFQSLGPSVSHSTPYSFAPTAQHM